MAGGGGEMAPKRAAAQVPSGYRILRQTGSAGWWGGLPAAQGEGWLSVCLRGAWEALCSPVLLGETRPESEEHSCRLNELVFIVKFRLCSLSCKIQTGIVL